MVRFTEEHVSYAHVWLVFSCLVVGCRPHGRVSFPSPFPCVEWVGGWRGMRRVYGKVAEAIFLARLKRKGTTKMRLCVRVLLQHLLESG